MHGGARGRHRRPERARAGLVHLRRRRPDVALQRQRVGAQDAHPAPDSLGDQQRQFDESTSGSCNRSSRRRSRRSWFPAKPRRAADAGQRSRWPFELQDFFLYYISRFGFVRAASPFWPSTPGAPDAGDWPEMSRPRARRVRPWGDQAWLTVFLHRFFETSQFKRSAMPNAPKVGSGGSLSPRSDWRAPSDGHADVWLQSSSAKCRKRRKGRGY